MDMSHHTTLGLQLDASKEDIIASYRRLAKTWHPDVNKSPDAASRFAAITEAYRALTSDGLTHAAPRHSEAPVRVVVRREVCLTVREAMDGCRKHVAGVAGPCAPCAGTGRTAAKKMVECVSCYGTGRIRPKGRGFIRIDVKCADCAGGGKVNWYRCHECDGLGTTDMISCVVDFPPASRHGDHLVVKGGANSRRGNVVGDVHISISVKDPDYAMHGDDILHSLSLPVWDCVLGCRRSVVTPSGEELSVSLPPDTVPGTRFRFPGKGLNYTDAKGDFVVIVKAAPLKSAQPGVREAMESLRAANA